MDLQLCGLQVWYWLVSTALWLVLVERQLDLSSLTARLRGGVVELCSVEVVWFSSCEHDKGVHRILNATALVVAFPLPPSCGPRLHACRVSRAKRHADVDLEKATPYSVALRVVFGALSPRGHRMEQGRCCAMGGLRVLRKGVVLVGLHCSLAYACGAAVGPFVRDCETER
ncbi:hypothetical protein Taro_009603 [Colocasia esculenta]|uniref:Uncharacterized protein n=1 Tax=Colocasia esculenta TaxID=4460 RepID=A0A843U0L9_COLES|nr:hypothetical protein [Colocasia esculenta]